MLIEDWAQSVPMEGEEAEAVLVGMRAGSEELAGRAESASSNGP